MSTPFLPYMSEGFLREETGRGRKERRFCTYLSMYPGILPLHGYTVTMRHRRTRAKFRRRERFYGNQTVCPSSWNQFLFIQRFSAGAVISDTLLGHARPRIRSVSAMSNVARDRGSACATKQQNQICGRASLRPSRQTASSECRLFRIEWIWSLGRDRIGLPPGMSLNRNHRIEELIFDDRGPAQYRCPMDTLLDIPWTLKRVPDSHSSGYLLPVFATV